MAVIGSVAFGCVVGWAVCFAAGWRIPVLLVRALWLGVFALFLLAGTSEHIAPPVAAAVVGSLAHLSFVFFLQNRRPRGQWARKVAL